MCIICRNEYNIKLTNLSCYSCYSCQLITEIPNSLINLTELYCSNCPFLELSKELLQTFYNPNNYIKNRKLLLMIQNKAKRKMNKRKVKGGLNRVGTVFVPREPTINQSFLP